MKTSIDNITALFFRRHNRTLESVVLSPSATQPEQKALKALASVGAPCLKRITLDNQQPLKSIGAGNLNNAATALMTTTSALQYLRMDKVDLQSWSQAFANMAEVKYLREVYLEQCTNPAFHGLHLLFTESHSLQTFHLYESRPGNPSMAVLLEALFSKQSIELHISSGASNDDIIDAAGWSDPIVEKLHITMSAMLTIRTLRMLTRLSQLKDPTLDSEYISQNDIYAYLQTRRLPTRVMLKAGKSEDGSITEVTVFLSFIHCVFHCPLHEG